jgi:predicted GTPase
MTTILRDNYNSSIIEFEGIKYLKIDIGTKGILFKYDKCLDFVKFVNNTEEWYTCDGMWNANMVKPVLRHNKKIVSSVSVDKINKLLLKKYIDKETEKMYHQIEDAFDVFDLEDKEVEENIKNDNNLIPKENINICFVGGVSTGKSTILNAIFCEHLTQCKIKRTTMVPTVYIENDETFNPFDKENQTEEIYKKISEKNQEIIEKTENGQKLNKSDYSELAFNVGKLDINILPDSFVNVYDVPGLNDARTKDVYYEYLEENFHKFNLVIFLVDIHSGLNTSDEIDIVNFITNNTKYQVENNNRKIYTIVVVNKADDMQLDEESSEPDKLILTGELSEMYEQVEKTITDEFAKKNVSDQLIGIIPLCAIDAYLYRMVKKHGRSFKLSPEHILKIGINENGKKFSTLKPATQEKRVYEILNDKNFIETMIKLSGFSSLEKMLHAFLNENDIGKKIRIDNLLYDLRKIPSLKKISDLNGWFNMIIFENVVKKHYNIYESIKKIDVNIYNEYIINIVEEIEGLLNKKVIQWNGTKDELLRFYDNFIETIMKRYFSNYVNSNYSTYLTDKIIGTIENEFDMSLTIDDILNSFEMVSKINMFNIETINKLLNKIISNNRCEKTILFDSNSAQQITKFISLLNKFRAINVEISRILRFVIINQLQSMRYSDDILIEKGMIYEKYGEIPISNYLSNNVSISHASVPMKIYIDGINSDTFKMNEFELDIYYLNYEKVSNPLNFR